MESKTKTTLKVTLLTLLMALSVILCTSVRKNVLKADVIDSVPMVQINAGFDKPFGYFLTSYDDDYARDLSYIDFRTSGGSQVYSYEVIYLGSDNAHINTIFLSMISNYTLTNLFFADKAIECGFYSGPTGSINYDTIILPYYIPRSYFLDANQNDVITCYVDVSSRNIDAEGATYFIVRYTEAYRLKYSTGFRPQVMFLDFQLNPNSSEYFNAGVETGKTEGYSLGYSAGVNAGYSQGYSAGADIGSEDYHIHDLLFTIFDTPFEVLHNLFSFTIFSTPVWTIIVSLLSLLVVLWLIKRLLT